MAFAPLQMFYSLSQLCLLKKAAFCLYGLHPILPGYA
jgi:hypothetical protein